jgi:tripartite-type tricarboxylate transporter receptor subunit TctC
MNRRISILTLCAALTGVSAMSYAQGTNKPIRILVPSGAASSGDILARELAQHLSEVLKQSVIVENRPGAEGVIGAQPDKFPFGYSSSSTRLSVEMFQQQTGTKIRGVPFRFTAASIAEVAAGRVDVMVIDPITANPFYRGGRVRPLFVTSTHRLKSLPDIPTPTEAGLPTYEITPWFGTFVASKTPAQINARLREALAQALKTPGMLAMMDKGAVDPFSECGEALQKIRITEIDRWREVIQRAGIQPE